MRHCFVTSIFGFYYLNNKKKGLSIRKALLENTLVFIVLMRNGIYILLKHCPRCRKSKTNNRQPGVDSH